MENALTALPSFGGFPVYGQIVTMVYQPDSRRLIKANWITETKAHPLNTTLFLCANQSL
jgi:hypothetical protein